MFLQGKQPGSRLWSTSSREMLLSIRKVLACLKVQNPELYTLKMFRAGHTTAFAQEGKRFGDILRAGE